MKVSKVLKEEAIKYGLCAAWAKDWGSPTKEQLVEMYITGLDFCIEHNYPSNEFIKENFGEIAEHKGVFVDKKVHLENPETAILNGRCTGSIVLTGNVSRDIYVRHDSRVEIVVRDYALAFVRVFDNAHVILRNESGKRCFVYKKGGTATVSGNVLVRE